MILISGASGMLGANLARALVRDGLSVRILLRGKSHPYLDGLEVERVVGDLRDNDSLARACRGVTGLYHVAGLVSYRMRDASALHQVNVVGTQNILDAALDAGVRRVVHVSSTAAVGVSATADVVLDETSVFDKRYLSDAYMRSKLLGEQVALRASSDAFQVVVVNPSTIFGAGDVHSNASGVLRRIREGTVRSAPPGGNSVVDVADVVRGMRLAMKVGEPGRRYILATERMTYLENFSRAAAAMGLGPRAIGRRISPLLREPAVLFARAAKWITPNRAMSPEFVRFAFLYRYFSAARAESELGWRPEVSFEESVHNTLEFERNHMAALRRA